MDMSRRSFLGLAGMAATSVLTACGGGSDAESEATQETASESTEAPLDSAEVTGTHHATIRVDNFGTIKLELYADQAPITVQNFMDLASDGFYDGLTFHRIIAGFMIQGGDPYGNGTGGSGRTIKGEFYANSMARSSEYDSASSQFFIVHQDSMDSLDGKYAAFGRVTDGMDVVDAIAENTPLPVTLKTRLGPHPRRTTVFELLDAAEQAGARGFILHARYTSQMHGGETHLDLLSEVVRRARIPVTGNGSVVDAKSAAAVAATGVDAVMVGRAALSRPAMFSALRGDAETSDVRRPTGGESSCRLFEKHLGYILEFRRQLAERFPNDHIPSEDAFASVKMHVHLFRYFAGRPGAAALRARLNRVRTLAEIREAVDSLLQ